MKLVQGDRQRISEQVVTPSAHMQDMQGVEPANQLLPSARSCPPYRQPNEGINKHTYTHTPFHPVVTASDSRTYLDIEGSKLLDRSLDACTGA